MSEIVRFPARHVAIGFGLATGFVTVLLLADPGGLGGLLRDPANGLLPAALLWGVTGLTFGAVQFGFALWPVAVFAPTGSNAARSGLALENTGMRS